MALVRTNAQDSKHTITWADYDKDIRVLANKIKKGGKKYALIYTRSRGGCVIATHLSHLLNIPWVKIDTFAGIPLPILVVDDIADTGKTLKEILDCRKDYITNIATLYRKDGTIVEPDYCAKTINKWVVFSWEY